ncbi:hypothetical protein B14_200100 (plasmid) [Bacillus licheniformis]|nr:hypothetical protein B14_200100 [Bacillus licheniformis]
MQTSTKKTIMAVAQLARAVGGGKSSLYPIQPACHFLNIENRRKKDE